MLFATAAVAGLFIAGNGGANAHADQVNRPAVATNATKTVTVQKGDTLWGLSQKYNVTLNALRAANKREQTSVIYVGEKLNLPNNAKEVAQSTSVAQPASQQPAQPAATAAQSAQPAQPAAATQATPAAQSNVASGDNNSAKAWIAQHESSGSYAASNGQYVGKYQLSASMLNGDYSAANQERVADQYVNGRYGSWDNAKSFWMQHGWY